MGNDSNNFGIVNATGISVFNGVHDGYCRGGFRLKRGENILPLPNAEKLEQLQNDPRLSVSIITESGEDIENPPEQYSEQVEWLLSQAVDLYQTAPEKFQTKSGEISIAKFRDFTSCKTLSIEVVQQKLGELSLSVDSGEE